MIIFIERTSEIQPCAIIFLSRNYGFLLGFFPFIIPCMDIIPCMEYFITLVSHPILVPYHSYQQPLFPTNFFPIFVQRSFLSEMGILLYISDWPRTSYVDYACPKLTVALLPLSPYCWDSRNY